MDRDELLEQCLDHFNETFSKNWRYKVNREINNKINRLKYQHKMKDNEIFNVVYQQFLEKKLDEKYQADKTLSTFIAYCVKYGLCDLVKQKRREHRKKECSLEALLNDPLCGSGASSFNIDEQDGFPSLVEHNTPEDLLIGKEMKELIFEHFGTTDALVLLGYEDLKKTATSLGMTYDAYRKRLWRKKEQFKAFLEKQGYCWN